MLEKLQSSGEDKKLIKELKIQKLKLKPLVDDYKLSLEKLKTELLLNNNNNNKRKTNNKNNKNSKKFKSSNE